MPNGVRAVGQGGLRVVPTFEQAAKVPPARLKPQETPNLNFFRSFTYANLVRPVADSIDSAEELKQGKQNLQDAARSAATASGVPKAAVLHEMHAAAATPPSGVGMQEWRLWLASKLGGGDEDVAASSSRRPPGDNGGGGSLLRIFRRKPGSPPGEAPEEEVEELPGGPGGGGPGGGGRGGMFGFVRTPFDRPGDRVRVEGNPYAPDIHHDPLEEARARDLAQASWWATQKVKFDDIFSSHHAPHLPQPGGQWEPTEEQLQVGRRFIADRHAIAPLSHHTASAISAAREERGEEQRRAMLRRLQALGASVDMDALRSVGLGALAGSAGMIGMAAASHLQPHYPAVGTGVGLMGTGAVMMQPEVAAAMGRLFWNTARASTDHMVATARQHGPAVARRARAVVGTAAGAGASLAAGTKRSIGAAGSALVGAYGKVSRSRKRALKDDDDDVGPLLA